ncbi:MAG: prepilin-type N-terminal cleavage/methylation domain-containing protein [Desulfuromonadaceae bacterium]|nr:prepilin-type N-terminal cleavage/methylation domain-containing protein [Desulfuromonadaceae bacterium]MDD2854928.1 prepilin-type N-terminal cleavage/methylation domain-containing protein [Desulfuromonadaceae bacterium]
MREKAFTLIEVMVVMAIISILAGMMVPAAWKFWEGEEIATTRERLEELKIAIVGNKKAQQTGIRTMFGFVGDNGELPFCNYSTSVQAYSLSLLVNKPNIGCDYPYWKGPYMSGFDPAEVFKDAWGRDVSYYFCKSEDDRYLSGALRSAGLDGGFHHNYDECDTERSSTFCEGDDICVALDRLEVAPTYRIQGNFAFKNLTSTGSNSARIAITYRDPTTVGGDQTFDIGCKTKTDAAFPNFTTLVVKDSVQRYLPIGKVIFKAKYYAGENCTGSETSDFVDYFIQDNTNKVFINFP